MVDAETPLWSCNFHVSVIFTPLSTRKCPVWKDGSLHVANGVAVLHSESGLCLDRGTVSRKFLHDLRACAEVCLEGHRVVATSVVATSSTIAPPELEPVRPFKRPRQRMILPPQTPRAGPLVDDIYEEPSHKAPDGNVYEPQSYTFKSCDFKADGVAKKMSVMPNVMCDRGDFHARVHSPQPLVAPLRSGSGGIDFWQECINESVGGAQTFEAASSNLWDACAEKDLSILEQIADKKSIWELQLSSCNVRADVKFDVGHWSF